MTERAQQTGGVGLMKERAQQTGGWVRVDDGEGTTDWGCRIDSPPPPNKNIAPT